MEANRSGEGASFKLWEPFVWEFSSAIAIIVLIPGILWLTKKHPLSWLKIKQSLIIYCLGALVFSILHIFGMVMLRELVYGWQNMNYDFGNLIYEFLYEFRKDAWTFIFIVIVIQSYDFILSRIRGEANLVANGEEETTHQPIDRLLVKKLGKEFIIKIADVEWLESSGNYVNLHIKDRIYPIRSTLSGFIENFAVRGFCRIHRSTGVNLEYVDTIEPMAGGDSEITLKNGQRLSVSRRYKEQLKLNL